MSAKLLPIRRRAGRSGEMSDEALVAACAERDPSALAALFDRYHGDVHRFLGRLAGSGVDEDVVDDLAQDTFVQLFESAGRFRRGSQVRTWLLGIASNLARQHVRSDMRRKARAAAYLERLPAEVGLPSDEVHRRQLRDAIAAAVNELPHDQRVAWLMCDVEEVRGVDAAKALGLRQGTLYRRLHEARRALRARLEEGAR